MPVKPRDFHPVTNNRIWVPHGTMVRCPKCGNQTLVKFPKRLKRGEVMLFGDEAARGDMGIYTYSLLGASRDLLPKIEQELLKFKQEIAATVAPDSWRLHMTEMLSGQQRRNHPIFNRWSRENVIAVVSGLFDLFARLAEDLFIFNISLDGLTNTPTELRDVAYISLVAELIDGFTEKGFQPHILFDADRPVTADHVIQSWARESFEGFQTMLLYPFLAKGIPIPEPKFVQPGSHPCLELADFVSFIIARYLWLLRQGKQIEFDPSRLGKVFYMVRRPNGDLAQFRQAGYPLAGERQGTHAL